MKIHIKRIDDAYKLEATNESGHVTYTDGSAALGASNSAFRPMELLLVSLAGCSAIDVINIMKKQKQVIHDFQMELSGDRVDGTPSPFETIDVHFILKGEIKEKKLEKAIQLTKDKYCSVLHTIRKETTINYRYTLD